MELFDCNVQIGRPARMGSSPATSTNELLDELKSSRITRALAWHIAQHDYSPIDGNAMLSEAIAGEESVFGCWTILPPQTGEVIDDGFFARMKENRIAALRAFPGPHNFILSRIAFGSFLEEITRRRIPLVLSLEKGITWPVVYTLLEQFPDLTCVLCDIGIWGVDRYTWPLLENCPNVYLETGHLSMEAGGTEATVAKYGADRLLFGSGFPERYPEAAALQLMHADISDANKEKIARANLERLISEALL